MLGTNPYQQYKEKSLAMLTPGEILVKLYEEMIKQLTLAKLKIDKKDFGAVHDCLTKCQAILATLSDSLDMRYPISADLRNLYIFLTKHILTANLKKDKKMVEDCIPIVRDLRDSFDEADKISRMSAAGAVSGRRAVL
jgi:flagellar protein FliS